MKRHFFELDPVERFDLLGDASRALNRPGVVLEKDLWVCWALEALFSDPSPEGAGVGSRSGPQQRMVFKGGTSLSKIYGAIHRFSEDLDITIDYREAHDPIADPFSSEVSNTQRRAFSERMRVFTAETVAVRILPKLQALATNLPVRAFRLNEAQDTISLEYESAFNSGYLLPQLKLEFGSRNAIEPNQIALVQPDLLAWSPAHDLLYPRAHVPVLLAERTYWEKVTLIHAEITRKNAKANTDRYSRHWYDLAMLAQHEIGARALQRTDLLGQVIHVKSLLFAVSGVNYQEVAMGACKLVPSDALHDGLERDYIEMINAGMFNGMPPTWSELMGTLGNLERRINALEQTNSGAQ